MADNSVIQSLSETEKKTLALCGITNDEQLARISPQSLHKDVVTAAAFFPISPDELPSIERLDVICRKAVTSIREARAARTTLPEYPGSAMVAEDPLPSDLEPGTEHRRSTATGRILVVNEDTREAEELSYRRKKDDPRGFDHAIRCTRPLSVYLGAWATLFLAAGIIVLLTGVLGILIGVNYKEINIYIAVLLGAILFFYLVMLFNASCSTCRIHIYSFRPYPRHRKAHHIPLLGHTLSTALSVLFLLRFRCPSCGTPQKLFGGHRHRSHRRH